jgi:hypothetical protein
VGSSASCNHRFLRGAPPWQAGWGAGTDTQVLGMLLRAPVLSLDPPEPGKIPTKAPDCAGSALSANALSWLSLKRGYKGENRVPDSVLRWYGRPSLLTKTWSSGRLPSHSRRRAANASSPGVMWRADGVRGVRDRLCRPSTIWRARNSTSPTGHRTSSSVLAPCGSSSGGCPQSRGRVVKSAINWPLLGKRRAGSSRSAGCCTPFGCGCPAPSPGRGRSTRRR